MITRLSKIAVAFLLFSAVEVEAQRHYKSQDCVGKWTEGSNCSSQCGQGYKYRKYKVIKEALYDGDECPRKDGHWQKTKCEGHCGKPVDCIQSQQCGLCEPRKEYCRPDDRGTKECRDTVKQEAENGGKECDRSKIDKSYWSQCVLSLDDCDRQFLSQSGSGSSRGGVTHTGNTNVNNDNRQYNNWRCSGDDSCTSYNGTPISGGASHALAALLLSASLVMVEMA